MRNLMTRKYRCDYALYIYIAISGRYWLLTQTFVKKKESFEVYVYRQKLKIYGRRQESLSGQAKAYRDRYHVIPIYIYMYIWHDGDFDIFINNRVAPS